MVIGREPIRLRYHYRVEIGEQFVGIGGNLAQTVAALPVLAEKTALLPHQGWRILPILQACRTDAVFILNQNIKRGRNGIALRIAFHEAEFDRITRSDKAAHEEGAMGCP